MTATGLSSSLADRYRIERELGAGGMATVYLARDLRHDRNVAIKVLRPELAAVIGAERFAAEIRTTANLQHPHLLPLFDSGTVDGTAFYVMPFVDGESLRGRLQRERQLPVTEALQIAYEVADALHYAHSNGIIHRDIKPENILLQGGHALVADFGIALAASKSRGSRMTETGMSVGTPQYMSPEQAMGERELDARTDVYAMGAVLYEMLVGEAPFTGPTAQAIVAKVLTETAPSARGARASVPEHVDDAIRVALEKMPADRFRSAAEFRAVLDGSTRGPRTVTRRATTIALRRWQIATVTASVAALAALGLFATTPRDTGNPTARPRGRFALVLPDSARMNRLPGSMSLSLDGSMLAYLSREPTTAIFVRRFDELTPRRVAGTDGASSPEFSPDGRSIGFVIHNSIMRVPIEGGTPVMIADSVGPSGLAWLDDGTIVFPRTGANGKQSLWKVSDAGGAATQLTTVNADEQRHQMPSRLPGGKAVFAIQVGAGASAPNEIAMVRVADGVVTRLGLKGVGPSYADGFLVFVKTDFTLGAVPFDATRGRTTGEPLSSPGTGTGAVAENGTMVFYPNANAMELVSVDRRGNAQPLMREARTYYYPRLSPDGRRVMVGIGAPPALTEVWMIDIASGTLTKLSADRFNLPDGWTPDGRRVVWSHGADAPALWSQPWDASSPAEKILDGAQGAHLVAGGTELLTTVMRSGGGRELRIVPFPIDTLRWSVPLTLRRAPGFSSARPSPDGKWIAYVDEQSGVTEVFVSARAGGRYQVSVGGGNEPIWSRDGKELFYRAPQRAMMSAHLELGAEPRVVKRDTLFPIGFPPGTVQANYDVTADGQHFIIPRPIAISEWPIVVIGWTDELRERMRGAKPGR